MRSSFDKFKLGDDVAAAVALDTDLDVERADEGRMPTRPLGGIAAVVHNDDEAIEGGADGVGGADVRAHGLVVIFAPAIDRFEVSMQTATGLTSPSCARMSATNCRLVADQTERRGMRKKGGAGFGAFSELRLAKASTRLLKP